MYIVCLDIGNTRMKAGVFHPNEKAQYFTFDSYTVQTLKEFQKKFPDCSFALSATTDLSEDITGFLEKDPHFFRLTHQSALPFKNSYRTPLTLGLDRIALIAGAQKLYPHSNCLIIDAGTCITLDFIREGSNYLGGSIHPGLEMRLKAVHHFTDKLPLVENKWQDDLIGQSTEECIKIGALSGAVKEIDSFIEDYIQKYPETMVLISGGDSELFFYKLKNKIFAHPNLVLIGLHQIALYNAK